MVFEQLVKVRWLESKVHALYLGFFYTLLGTLSAGIIFPRSGGLMSVAFVSILLIPSLAKLLELEENVEVREKKFSLRLLFADHKDIFKVYLLMFLGIFLGYSVISIFLSFDVISNLFSSQLGAAGLAGFATTGGLLSAIIFNNLLVFIVSFILSLMYGAGAVLFLTWNASVWAVVLVFLAKDVVMFEGASFVNEYAATLIPILPHLITEAVAYISAAIMGGVISKGVIREKLFSKKFNHLLTDGLIFLVLGLVLMIIAAVVEVSVI